MIPPPYPATSLPDPVTPAHGGTGLTTLTAHALQVGNGTGTPTQVGPDASTTKALFAAGAAADPAFRAIAAGDLPTSLTPATITGSGASTSAATGTVTLKASDSFSVNDTWTIWDAGGRAVTFKIIASGGQYGNAGADITVWPGVYTLPIQGGGAPAATIAQIFSDIINGTNVGGFGGPFPLPGLGMTASAPASNVVTLTDSATGYPGNVTITDSGITSPFAHTGMSGGTGLGLAIRFTSTSPFTFSQMDGGTSTLASGTKTISSAIAARSLIFAFLRDAAPGAGNLTVGLEAPVASRNVGAGTFVVRANIAAGTINTLDTSTFDWLVIN